VNKIFKKKTENMQKKYNIVLIKDNDINFTVKKAEKQQQQFKIIIQKV
jgi:hypothetical protein